MELKSNSLGLLNQGARRSMVSNAEETIIRTACPAHCAANACGILAHVRDGKVVKLEPADESSKDRRLRSGQA